jgi:hypothetical protein
MGPTFLHKTKHCNKPSFKLAVKQIWRGKISDDSSPAYPIPLEEEEEEEEEEAEIESK